MEHLKHKAKSSIVLDTIIDILTQVCAKNLLIPESDESERNCKIFNTSARANHTIDSFLRRIKLHFELCDNGLIVMIIYITKLSLKLTIRHKNVLKIALGAALAAVKYCYDDIYGNNVYAKIGGITLDKLNRIETSFIGFINYELYIPEDLFRLNMAMFNVVKSKAIMNTA